MYQHTLARSSLVLMALKKTLMVHKNGDVKNLIKCRHFFLRDSISRGAVGRRTQDNRTETRSSTSVHLLRESSSALRGLAFDSSLTKVVNSGPEQGLSNQNGIYCAILVNHLIRTIIK